jgi:hypothetical protein
MLRLLSMAVLVGALSSVASPSSGALPQPANSTKPACLATTPGGNIVSLVIVRDIQNVPISNSLVVIDYNNCTGFVPCLQGSSPLSDGYIVDPVARTIRMFTGPQGQAPFSLRAGGGCSNNGIRITADGVPLVLIHAASADQNGDLSVDGVDVAIVHSKIGTSDLSGDINCDGVVDAADEGIVTGYLGVNCNNPTESRHASWGKLKTIYR